MAVQKGKEKEEEPSGPTQNKALICGIFLCQAIVVLSIVSFIYLSVAIYKPSYRAFNSGYEPEPVTCHTLEVTRSNKNISWVSCGEWCLTKSSGKQIYVNVRRNSTDIVLENCSHLSTNSCPNVNPETFKVFNCNNGSECGALTGLFNCTYGHCANMSDQLLCNYKADGMTIDSEKDNIKLIGFFECYKSRCTKIKQPFTCERTICPRITTNGNNAFLMYEEAVYAGQCDRAVTSRACNGSSPSYEIPTTEIWNEDKNEGFLLASCTSVTRINNSLWGQDCLNGTVLPFAKMPELFMNFTTFWSIFEKSNQPLDPSGMFLPFQSQITIYPVSKLLINLDGCVNTLRGECKAFEEMCGKAGFDHTAVSKFPCFYNKNNSEYVLSRFDLETTHKELFWSLLVPSVLFAISFTTLAVVTRTVKVDEDSILRCHLFGRRKEKVEPEEEHMVGEGSVELEQDAQAK